MESRILRKTRVGAIVLALLLMLSALVVPVSAAEVQVSPDVEQQLAEYRRFIEYRYEIDMPPEWTFQFVATLLSVDLDDLTKGTMTDASAVLGAVEFAVKAAKLSELAATYPDEKVNSSLTAAGLDSVDDVSDEYRALAVAIDLQILPPDMLNELDLEGEVSEDLAVMLIGKVLEFNGLYKNYLGDVSDPDIYAKVQNEWGTQLLLEAEDARDIVNTLLEDDVITGYNLKDLSYDPRFDPELTITYGHSNIKHAVQLIGLLRSEGLDAHLQLEPKTSAYIHLAEWGEPEISKEFNVEQIENGNFIAYAKEYDISLEFFSKEDKEAFQPIILAYAKRNQEDMTGLIAGSWWQPLYYSLTPLDSYVVVTNNYIQDGFVQVQTFSLNEDSDAVVEAMNAIADNYEVSTYEFWVDEPFYNYLIGEAK